MSDPAVYVHLPFCETKCPYCDFNSFAVAGRDVDGYLDALAREMDTRGVPRRPPTVFVGGGTPTVVEPEQLDRYLGDLVRRLAPDPRREFTVEANPGSLTAEKVAVLVRHGVNRVSLGAQSIFDRHLRTLGRVHAADDIEQAYRLVRAGGIENVNLDFIHSVPGLTVREWVATLRRAIEWAPEHLACYALVFEPGTEFHARRSMGQLRPAPERAELAMFRLTERLLRGAGYERYEISNFARPGRECRHNLNYWRNGSYAGFGAGAWSYLGGVRLGNERRLERYAASIGVSGTAFVTRERLAGADGAAEMVVLGLRTRDGVDLDDVGSRFGLDAWRRYGGVVESLRAGGYVRTGGGRLRLARRGWRVADEIAKEFL